MFNNWPLSRSIDQNIDYIFRDEYQQTHPGEKFMELPDEYATVRAAMDNITAPGVQQIFVHNDQSVLNKPQCKFILL